MKFSKAMMQLAGAEKGTEAMFQFDEVISETQDESEALAELRKQAADGEVMQDGEWVPKFRLLVESNPPFNGRVVFPQEPKGNEEHFWTFSVQGAEIVFAQKYGRGRIDQIHFEPINSSPANDTDSYACIGAEMNGTPCFNLISKDRQRAIVVASVEGSVVDGILDRILSPIRIGTTMWQEAHVERWKVILDEIETIAITVKTVAQALRALSKYRPYLEPRMDRHD